MNIPRRRFLSLAGAGAIFPSIVKFSRAESYPTRPIHFVVGFPAGGPNDILARLIGQWLSDRLGQPVIVENKPGASGNVATEAVVRAPADGYTLLMVGPANAINASLHDELKFNFCATSRRSRRSHASRSSCSSTHRFRQKAFQNLSPMRRRTQARLRWHRPGMEAHLTFPAYCSQ